MTRTVTPPAPGRTATTTAPPLPRGVLVAGAAGLAAVLVLALVVGGARPVSGLASGGPLVDWGRPVAGLAARVAAIGTVGSLLFCAALLPSPASVPWQRAVRAASGWALAWVAATVVTTWLTVAEVVGAGPFALPLSSVATFLTDLPAGRAAAGTVAAACCVALVAAFRPGVGSARSLLVVAGAGLVVPAVLTGHAATAADHYLAVTNLAVHVVTAAVWVGGLGALLAFGRDADLLGRAAVRFSAIALACFALMGVSGVLAAWLATSEAGGSAFPALGTGYGALLLGKTAALLALGGIGWAHRRHSLPGLAAGRPGAFRRFAVVEVGVMLVTVALAVALSASPPPAPDAPTPAPAAATAGSAPAEPSADPMAGHDHGELSVSVLVDRTRFHVAGPVEAGSRVTVFHSGDTEVTITADDGSFDVVVPPGALMTFEAPTEPGEYPFGSRHSEAFEDVLVVE